MARPQTQRGNRSSLNRSVAGKPDETFSRSALDLFIVSVHGRASGFEISQCSCLRGRAHALVVDAPRQASGAVVPCFDPGHLPCPAVYQRSVLLLRRLGLTRCYYDHGTLIRLSILGVMCRIRRGSCLHVSDLASSLPKADSLDLDSICSVRYPGQAGRRALLLILVTNWLNTAVKS